MPTKLNQIVAVEKGKKGKANREFTELYHLIQKQPLLSGLTKTYQPKDEDGDRLPGESQIVQTKVPEILEKVAETLTELYDVTFTKDTANTHATANVTLPDGTVLIENVPVQFLLFLEKQLTDLHTFVKSLPTLDPSVSWTYDQNAGVYRTDPVETHRTKKVMKSFVKAPATDKHPAQVDTFTEDEIVGYWTTTRFSGSLPADRVETLLDRVNILLERVKFAREEANTTEIEQRNCGEEIFNFLFA